MVREQPFWLGGRAERSGRVLDVINPFDGATVARTWLAGPAEFDRATDAAIAAAPAMRGLAAYERSAILSAASAEIRNRRDEIARAISLEAGKPIKDATTEADRATMTFQVAAEEARRLEGDVIPIDLAPHGKGRLAITRRFPIGPVAAISPFNFPFNLAAHKVAPAIAAGNPVVLKPASKTPISALLLGEIVQSAGLPPGAISVLPMDRETGDRLVTDERYKLLTFTGSSAVGWRMKARAGKKRIILELGGNAGVIVDDGADLDFAAARVTAGGFAFAGQSCIAVQRVFVHDRVFDEFASKLVANVERLKLGDPIDQSTDLGPLIEEDEAARIDAWVKEAMAAGARALTGGRRCGRAMYMPTVLVDVPLDAKVCTQEVFAPLVALAPYTDFQRALELMNASSYGLQAGIFTPSLEHTLAAFDALDVGGVMVNEVPTWRIDHMPYGGVKDSGLGREGPRYTIEEMTELKLLVINRHAT
jgi:acyl-CoA reductase-like NAD-dependent aldehyde dehydrogenase